MPDVYSTGQLARAAGVHVETVRYYERRGLLAEPGRRPSGYRNYTPADLRRLQAVVHLKSYGFTLSEIAQLLDDCGDPHATCGELQARFRAKRDELRRTIAELTACCATIDRALALSEPDTALAACPEVVPFTDPSSPSASTDHPAS